MNYKFRISNKKRSSVKQHFQFSIFNFQLPARLCQILLIISIVILTPGCGFYSFTGASIAPDVKTISVQYFPNNASIVNPRLSQLFTDALKQKFLNQTSLKFSNSGGDLNFEGAITGYTVTSTAAQSNETSGLTKLTVTVNVKFTNNKDPDKNFEKGFSRDYSYESTLTLAQAESTYLSQIIDAIVDDIFAASVANW